MANSAEPVAIDVADAIAKIKYALNVAQLQASDTGLPFRLGAVELELKVVQGAKNTLKPKFTVPVVDLEIGVEANVSAEQTQVLKISLAPPELTTKGFRESVPIDIPLTAALLEIANVVHVAGQGEPQLVLGKDGASISLQLVFAADGALSLLV